MAGWKRLNGLAVGRKVVVRNLSQHRRARVNYKSQQEKSLDEGIANRKQEEGDSQHPLDDRDFEAWLEEFYKLYKLSKFRRRVRDTENLPCCWISDSSLADGYTYMRAPKENKETPKRPEKKLVDQKKDAQLGPKVEEKKPEESRVDPSLADGYTHLSKIWLNQGGTRSTTSMAANTDHTSQTINGQSRPIRENNKFEQVALSLVAALLFVIGGCLALSFSSPEVNGALFAPIVCVFTAGYVSVILYDIVSRSLNT